MNKEDADQEVGVDEPFLNETLAYSEISELFEPKVLVNAKRYDKNGKKQSSSPQTKKIAIGAIHRLIRTMYHLVKNDQLYDYTKVHVDR